MFAGFAVLVLMVLTNPVLADHPGVANWKNVIAAIPRDFPPDYQLDDNGDPTGFAIEVMNALAQRVGVNVHYLVKNSWKEVNAAILNGEADLIPIQGITEERDIHGDFTSPLATFNIVIVVRRGDTSLNNAGQLSGRRVGAVETNIGVDILRSIGDVHAVVFDGLADAFFSLLAGQIDALIYPEPILWRFARNVGNEDKIRIVGTPLKEVKRAIFIRSDRSDLLTAFNQAASGFIRTDEYQTIFGKWYSKQPGYWTPHRILTLAGSISIAAIILILLWSNRAKIVINKILRKTVADLEDSQALLHRREAAYRSLYDNSPVAFLSIDTGDGAILNCNDATASLTGHSTEDLKTMKVFDLYADTVNGVEKATVHFECVKSGQRVDQEQLQIKCKDGTVRWVSLSANPISDDEGNTVETRSTLTDISALKHAERQLQLSEERFRTVAQSAPVGIFRVDTVGSLTFVNGRCCELTGRHAEEQLGDGWLGCVFPPDQDRVGSEWRHSIETGEPFESEFRVLRLDEEKIWVVVRIESERDGQGNVIGRLGSMTDITDIKRAKLAAVDSETRFILALENLPDVIVLYDLDLRITYINAATLKVSGRPKSDFIGNRDIDVWPPEIYQTYLPKLKEARDTGQITMVKAVLKLAGDGPRHLEIKCVPILGEDGTVRQIMGVTHDLTEVERAEADLIISEERFALAMQAVNDGLWDWDLLTDEVYFSPPWKLILGYEDSEIANDFNEWERRVHPDDLVPAQNMIDRCIKDPKVLFEVEFRMRHKDGNWVDILSRASVKTASSGKAIRIIGTHVDITERKVSEREIQRLNRIRETISQCNSALVHVTEEGKLLQKMCDILIDTRGYDLVWVGYANDDAEKNVSIMAASGDRLDYVKGIAVHWGDDDLGRGPTGTAIRTGKVQVVPDLEKAPQYSPWIEAAKKRDFRTSIALPLSDGRKTLGALIIYSATLAVFDDEEVKILTEFSEDLSYGIRMARAQIHQKQTQDKLSETLLDTIGAIAMTVEKRDPYTAGHQSRVASLSAEIARSLGWDQDRVEGLRLGATIHDIGKIYIPAEILNRPGKLSEYEFGMIKTHTEVGYEIISGIDFPWPVSQMVLQHHERLDGSGYPNGVKGDEIIDEAKIIAVADVVEAVTSHRPYRPALGIEVGIKEIKRGRGTAFDPKIVDACLRVLEEDGFRWEN